MWAFSGDIIELFVKCGDELRLKSSNMAPCLSVNGMSQRASLSFRH